MRTRYGVMLLLAEALTGCDLADVWGHDCTLELRPGIRLHLIDATTSAPIVSDEVEMVAREGSYADTARSGSNQLAHERAGVYEVEVKAAGYLPWDTSGVVVTEGRCHVRTVDVTAELTPES